MKMRIFLFIIIICQLSLFSFLPLLAKDVPAETQPVLLNQLVNQKDLIKQIVKEFQRHNYKKVIRLYQDSYLSQPSQLPTLSVRVLYSQALADTGDLEGAIKTLQETINELTPKIDFLKLRYDLANLLYLQRRYDEARAIYQKIIHDSSQYNEILSKSRERIGFLKDKNAKKKDFISLQLLDIESSLDIQEVPDGAEVVLQQIIDQNPLSPQAEYAKNLQSRLHDLRTEKSKALLDEARRLFDEEKKYPEVREIIEQITRSYADVAEMPSVEALLKAVDAREGKR